MHAPGHVVTEKVREIVTEYGLVGARMNTSGKVPTWRNHASARQVRDHLGQETWTRYLKLTSVRHPYTRTLSQFYFHLLWRKMPLPVGLDANRSAFAEFIFSKFFRSDAYLTNLDGKHIIDDAFRLEFVDEDLSCIGQKLGVELTRAQLPKTKDNSGGKPDLDFATFFTPVIQAEIDRKQGWVFDHYGYSRDLSTCRF